MFTSTSCRLKKTWKFCFLRSASGQKTPWLGNHPKMHMYIWIIFCHFSLTLLLSLLFRKLSDVGNGGRRVDFDFLSLPLSLSGAAFNKASTVSFNSVSVSVRNLFNPNRVGFLGVRLEAGGTITTSPPRPPLSKACLKLVRIMLETWNLVGKYTQICSFRKYLF